MSVFHSHMWVRAACNKCEKDRKQKCDKSCKRFLFAVCAIGAFVAFVIVNLILGLIGFIIEHKAFAVVFLLAICVLGSVVRQPRHA